MEGTDHVALRHALPAQLRDHGVVALDLEGRVADWNFGAQRLLGIAPEAAVGRPLTELLGETAVQLGRLLEEAAAGRDTTSAGWIAPPGRGQFWAQVTVNALRERGETIGLAVVIHDDTERKRMEDEIRRSSTVFERILAIATDAVVCVDSGQRITFFNQGAERIFGYSAGEVLSQPLDLLIPESLRQRHATHLQRFAQSSVSSRPMGERGEIAGRRKDGTSFPAEASISKLQVGESTVFTAVLRDVSERRAAEEVLARQAAELARSNAELEQFAYVASHDLQEPLRMVASYTQLLARRYRDRLDSDAEEFIGFAVDGVTRMQALINDLLAYSRVGRREIARDDVDVAAVLERVLITLRPVIDETGATVTYDDMPTLRGDAVQISQLLQNLIANGLKFRTEAAPRVHVGVRDEGAMWRFSVRDNGIGIAPEFSERIFDIFQRLHNRAEYPGTGIGLAICKKIVERHGGRIWVESREGEGSTFHFTLPKAGEYR